MPKPGEHKTVQNRILTYAQEIDWTFVPRSEAETRREFDRSSGNIQQKAQQASLYFDDLLYQKVREFNPHYTEPQGVLISQLYISLMYSCGIRAPTIGFFATRVIATHQHLQENLRIMECE